MARTYRDVAIEQMILTVQEAMSRTIDWWGELPAPMNEALIDHDYQRNFRRANGRETSGSNSVA
jgi:hypothetical protein